VRILRILRFSGCTFEAEKVQPVKKRPQKPQNPQNP
jgi:hypothetical protein